MPVDHTPITDAEMRWIFRVSRLAEQGITYERSLEVPALRAALELGVHRWRRRRAAAPRPVADSAGVGIERSHPDYSSNRNTY